MEIYLRKDHGKCTLHECFTREAACKQPIRLREVCESRISSLIDITRLSVSVIFA